MRLPANARSNQPTKASPRMAKHSPAMAGASLANGWNANHYSQIPPSPVASALLTSDWNATASGRGIACQPPEHHRFPPCRQLDLPCIHRQKRRQRHASCRWPAHFARFLSPPAAQNGCASAVPQSASPSSPRLAWLRPPRPCAALPSSISGASRHCAIYSNRRSAPSSVSRGIEKYPLPPKISGPGEPFEPVPSLRLRPCSGGAADSLPLS